MYDLYTSYLLQVAGRCFPRYTTVIFRSLCNYTVHTFLYRQCGGTFFLQLLAPSAVNLELAPILTKHGHFEIGDIISVLTLLAQDNNIVAEFLWNIAWVGHLLQLYFASSVQKMKDILATKDRDHAAAAQVRIDGSKIFSLVQATCCFHYGISHMTTLVLAEDVPYSDASASKGWFHFFYTTIPIGGNAAAIVRQVSSFEGILFIWRSHLLGVQRACDNCTGSAVLRECRVTYKTDSVVPSCSRRRGCALLSYTVLPAIKILLLLLEIVTIPWRCEREPNFARNYHEVTVSSSSKLLISSVVLSPPQNLGKYGTVAVTMCFPGSSGWLPGYGHESTGVSSLADVSLYWHQTFFFAIFLGTRAIKELHCLCFDAGIPTYHKGFSTA